jgi:hypothetical protein
MRFPSLAAPSFTGTRNAALLTESEFVTNGISIDFLLLGNRFARSLDLFRRGSLLVFLNVAGFGLHSLHNATRNRR